MDSGGIDRYIMARAVRRVSTGASRPFMHRDIRESLGFDLHKYLKEGAKAMSEIVSLATKPLAQPAAHPRMDRGISRRWSIARTAVNWTRQSINFTLD